MTQVEAGSKGGFSKLGEVGMLGVLAVGFAVGVGVLLVAMYGAWLMFGPELPAGTYVDCPAEVDAGWTCVDLGVFVDDENVRFVPGWATEYGLGPIMFVDVDGDVAEVGFEFCGRADGGFRPGVNRVACLTAPIGEAAVVDPEQARLLTADGGRARTNEKVVFDYVRPVPDRNLDLWVAFAGVFGSVVAALVANRSLADRDVT